MAKKVNLNKENNEKLRLKRTGHSYIDQIKWKGYSKDQVYLLLSHELGREERHAHFSAMNTLRELRPAVEALERLLNKLPNTKYAYTNRGKVIQQKCPIVIEVPVAKAITLEVPKKKPTKRQKLKSDVLPRAQVLKALEEMKKAKLLGEGQTPTVQGNKIQLKGGLYIYIKRFLRL